MVFNEEKLSVLLTEIFELATYHVTLFLKRIESE